MELCMNGVCDMIAKVEANSIESVKEDSSAGLLYEVLAYSMRSEATACRVSRRRLEL